MTGYPNLGQMTTHLGQKVIGENLDVSRNLPQVVHHPEVRYY